MSKFPIPRSVLLPFLVPSFLVACDEHIPHEPLGERDPDALMRRTYYPFAEDKLDGIYAWANQPPGQDCPTDADIAEMAHSLVLTQGMLDEMQDSFDSGNAVRIDLWLERTSTTLQGLGTNLNASVEILYNGGVLATHNLDDLWPGTPGTASEYAGMGLNQGHLDGFAVGGTLEVSACATGYANAGSCNGGDQAALMWHYGSSAYIPTLKIGY